MITAKVICDSVSERGHRVTTLETTFHRFLLPEVLMYRVWSRSSTSSRAIPLAKRIEEVRQNPAIPVTWPKNRPGMVAYEDLEPEDGDECCAVWLEGANAAADYASYFADKKLHKETAARVLEPFLWHTMVITGTEFDNMFKQRIHKDAQPEFYVLASEIKKVYDESKPEILTSDQWHLPFVTQNEKETFPLEDQQKLSAARCAKTSYGNQGKSDTEKDFAIFERLVTEDPRHYGPLEHVAKPVGTGWLIPLGNLTGWYQLRHLI